MPKHVVCGYLYGDPFAIPVPDLDRTDFLVMLGALRGSIPRSLDLAGKIPAIECGDSGRTDLGWRQGASRVPVSVDQVLLPVVAVLIVFFVGWYVAGNELMRRRARALAIWCREVLDQTGGRLSIQWLTTNSFRLHLAGGRAPLANGTLTGLTEAWDVPVLWLWNRTRGRRDMVLVQLKLHRQPIFGLELYRPGSLLAGDARHAGRLEGWAEEAMDEFRFAAGAGRARDLATGLLATLGGERRHLIRLAVRRQSPNLTLALNAPRSERPDPVVFNRLLRAMAERTLGYASPAPD